MSAISHFFFGHTFGQIQSDGFQYCKTCGKAVKPSIPHPCRNGHIWRDTGEPSYVETLTTFYEKSKMYYIPQKCTICGTRRSVSQY